ncbi:MarR family transcriptional regulator [Patulibacter sp. NPDC049589]|uniref:MarR family transcriptional regulator n=1 Tax=Patulibacter sp. NPDC049589 TaxID=3154731 RepID=UPI0034162D49
MPPLPFDPIREAGRQWETHWGAETAAPMEAVISIVRAQQIVVARLNAVLRDFDLTYSRYETLMLLFYSGEGALPLGKMGVRLQVHLTNVTKLVDALEARGLAERTPHPEDRRTTLATITPRGREVAEAATHAVNAIDFGTAPLAPGALDDVIVALRDLRREAGDFDDAE